MAPRREPCFSSHSAPCCWVRCWPASSGSILQLVELREDRGKRERREREEKWEKSFRKFFLTLSSLCLPSVFPFSSLQYLRACAPARFSALAAIHIV